MMKLAKIKIRIVVMTLFFCIISINFPAHGKAITSSNFSQLAILDTGFTKDITIKDNLAFVAGGGSGLYIYHFTPSLNYSLIKQWSPVDPITGHFHAKSLAIADNVCYLAASEAGLFAIDIANPDDPELLSIYQNNTNYFGVEQVHVNQEVAFIASNSRGLEILNASDLSQIHQISLLTPFSTFSHVCFAISGDIALVGFQTYDALNNTFIYNISDYSNPEVLSSFRLPYALFSQIAVQGNLAMFLCNDGIQFFNVQNPNSPQFIKEIVGGGYPTGIHVSGSVAYVLDGNYGIELFNISIISQPSAISFLGECPDHSASSGIWGLGNTIYACMGAPGTYVYQFTGDWNAVCDFENWPPVEYTDGIPTETQGQDGGNDPDNDDGYTNADDGYDEADDDYSHNGDSMSSDLLPGLVLLGLLGAVALLVVHAAMRGQKYRPANTYQSQEGFIEGSFTPNDTLSSTTMQLNANYPPINRAMRYCPECGSLIGENGASYFAIRYCANCGHKIHWTDND